MTPEEYEKATKIVHEVDNGNSNVAFVYVPKTGGTYLSISPVPIEYHSNKIVKGKYRASKLPSNVHMPCSKIQEIVGDKVPLFTIVRDPYDRTCSEYFFIKEKTQISLDYVKTWDLNDDNKLKFLAHLSGRIMGNPAFYDKIYNIYKYKMSIDEYLEWASDNPTYPFYYDTKSISDFDIVGVTEDLPRTMQLLKVMYDTNSGGGDYNKNTVKEVGKPYETSYSRSAFKAKNVIEYDMYYQGIDKFNKLCSTYL